MNITENTTDDQLKALASDLYCKLLEIKRAGYDVEINHLGNNNGNVINISGLDYDEVSIQL